MNTEDKTQELISQYAVGYIVTDLATQDQKVIQLNLRKEFTRIRFRQASRICRLPILPRRKLK